MGNHKGRVRLALVFGVIALLGSGCSSDSGSTGGAGEVTTSTGGPSEGGTGGEFSVLSYNVAGLPEEISGENPAANIPLISPRLDEFDIVITQEDFDWWSDVAANLDFVHYHQRLRADTTHEHRSPKHPGPEAAGLDLTDRQDPYVGDGLGILSRFPLVGDDRVPWDGCFGSIDTSDRGAADCLAMKGFQMTRVSVADGVLVDLYNLHGEAGGSEDDQALQADDFAQLAAYIEENSAGNAVILGGDTNLHTDMEHEDGSNGADIEIWDKFLEATGLTDACTAVECDHPGRIDKMAFRSSDSIGIEALSHRFHGEEFVNDQGDALSDHEPLEVRFRWTAL